MEPLKIKEKVKLTEVWFKLVLIAFFILLYLLAIPYPEKARQFPQLIALFSLIMIVISLILDLTRKGAVAEGIGDVDDTELRVLDAITQKTKRKRFYKAWAIILVSTAIGFLGGFLFTALILLMGFAMLFGERRNLFRNTVVAITMTIIIFFIFQGIFEVPLLKSFIW